MGSVLLSTPIIAPTNLDRHQILRNFCHESVRKGLIWSAHDRSAVRASTACSVRTAGAIDGSSVIGMGVRVFPNNRSPVGSSTARSIHAIGANDCIRLMGYSEPAEKDDDRERVFPHDRLPVESLTMLPAIEAEQANRQWLSRVATRGDSPSLVNHLI
jgi:hypothetical protein